MGESNSPLPGKLFSSWNARHRDQQTSTLAKREDARCSYIPYEKFITLIVEHLEEEQALPVRSSVLHCSRQLSRRIESYSSFGRKIEKSFTTFVAAQLYAISAPRFEDRGESDNLQPDESGHSLEVKHRSLVEM